MRYALLFSLLLTLAAAAPAAAKPIVGLGDQSADMFADPAYQRLGMEHSRLVVPWNWQREPHVLMQVDAWMAAARTAGVRPLVAFGRDYSKGGEKRLPSMRAYRRMFRAFRARYRHVREFSPWNEANHAGQPTAKRPRRAAQFYNYVRTSCRRCTIVAADVLDSSNMVPWVRKFKRYAIKPRIWGLHSYKDANDGGSLRTRALLAAVKGKVWMTETGGILRLERAAGSRVKDRRHTQAQQARAVRRVLGLAKVSRRIARIYFYEWKRQRGNRWDSALLNANGTKRPAYHALRRGLKRVAR
jgi:hypothetical protein